MNSLKKPLLVAGIISTVGAGALFTGAVANAESGQGAGSDYMSSLVDKLATTFNLDKSKVQEVFDAQHTEMETKRAEAVKERLQKLVDEGTITAAQKTAIEAKLVELKKEREANRGEMKDLSKDEHRTKMDEKRSELESWAVEQGIDLSKIKGVLGGHGGREGRGGPRG